MDLGNLFAGVTNSIDQRMLEKQAEDAAAAAKLDLHTLEIFTGLSLDCLKHIASRSKTDIGTITSVYLVAKNNFSYDRAHHAYVKIMYPILSKLPDLEEEPIRVNIIYTGSNFGKVVHAGMENIIDNIGFDPNMRGDYQLENFPHITMIVDATAIFTYGNNKKYSGKYKNKILKLMVVTDIIGRVIQVTMIDYDSKDEKANTSAQHDKPQFSKSGFPGVFNNERREWVLGDLGFVAESLPHVIHPFKNPGVNSKLLKNLLTTRIRKSPHSARYSCNKFIQVVRSKIEQVFGWMHHFQFVQCNRFSDTVAFDLWKCCAIAFNYTRGRDVKSGKTIVRFIVPRVDFGNAPPTGNVINGWKPEIMDKKYYMIRMRQWAKRQGLSSFAGKRSAHRKHSEGEYFENQIYECDEYCYEDEILEDLENFGDDEDDDGGGYDDDDDDDDAYVRDVFGDDYVGGDDSNATGDRDRRPRRVLGGYIGERPVKEIDVISDSGNSSYGYDDDAKTEQQYTNMWARGSSNTTSAKQKQKQKKNTPARAAKNFKWTVEQEEELIRVVDDVDVDQDFVTKMSGYKKWFKRNIEAQGEGKPVVVAADNNEEEEEDDDEEEEEGEVILTIENLKTRLILARKNKLKRIIEEEGKQKNKNDRAQQKHELNTIHNASDREKFFQRGKRKRNNNKFGDGYEVGLLLDEDDDDEEEDYEEQEEEEEEEEVQNQNQNRKPKQKQSSSHVKKPSAAAVATINQKQKQSSSGGGSGGQRKKQGTTRGDAKPAAKTRKDKENEKEKPKPKPKPKGKKPKGKE